MTHRRDERIIRPTAFLPKTYLRNGQELLYPKDPQGGGTWITSGQRPDDAPLTVCLLNGAFSAHVPQPSYKYSRGLVPLQVFDYESIDDFLCCYDPTGLKPFALLLAQADRLVELRWNGRRVFINDKNSRQPHIWSSATLYSPEVIEQRNDWFHDWLNQHPYPSVADIRQFHQIGGRGDTQNAIRMNRNNALMTLSLTNVVHQDETTTMIYEDFIQQKVSQLTLTQPEYAIV